MIHVYCIGHNIRHMVNLLSGFTAGTILWQISDNDIPITAETYCSRVLIFPFQFLYHIIDSQFAFTDPFHHRVDERAIIYGIPPCFSHLPNYFIHDFTAIRTVTGFTFYSTNFTFHNITP